MFLRAVVVFCVLAVPALAAGPVAYVSNENGGVSVIDLDTLKIVNEIDIEGKQPRGIAVTDDGAYVLSANKLTDDVSVIDTKAGKVTRRIKVGKGPEFIRVRGNRAYVTYEPDAPPPPTAEGAAPAQAPKEADKDDDDRLAHIAIIDLKTWKVLRSIKAGLETEGVEFSPDGKQIVTANEGGESLTVFTEANGRLTKTISTKDSGIRPRGIKIGPDGMSYFATLEGSSTLLKLDAKFNLVKSTATKTGPYGLAFSPNGKRLVVATARASVLQVFDAETLEPVAEAPVGMRCWHFAYSPDGSKILAACGRSNEVRVINAHDYTPVTTIAGLKLPWGIATYPKTNGSLQ